MRWIFILLLCANAAVYGYNIMNPTMVTRSANPLPKIDRHDRNNIEELIVMTEADVKKLKASVGQKKTKNTLSAKQRNLETADDNEAFCFAIGPFESEENSQNFLRELDNSITTIESIGMQMIKVPLESKYLVHLPSFGNWEKAMDAWQSLQNENVDSFIIKDGDLKFGISLGFFEQQKLAEKRSIQLRESGHNVKIKEVRPVMRQFWMLIDDQNNNKISQSLWQDLKSDYPYLEKRSNQCELIASDA